MAVIGSKGTYAQVQAPKDYLGNALSNVEQMNFKYREEKRQQEELNLARQAAAEKERLDRQDKAQDEASKLKAENSGDNRLNVSMQNLVSQKANRYAELKQKTNLTSEERSEIDEIPRLVDRLKFTSQNFKSFLDATLKDVGEDKINLDLLEDGQDILGSIYNLKKGAIVLDNKGNAMLELVDPDDPNKKITEPIDKFGDIGYLQSLVPRKQKILGKDGLVGQLSDELAPKVDEKSKGGYIYKTAYIDEEQKNAAMQTIESFVSNDMKLKDAAQQLKLNYKWKNDAEKEKTKQAVKEAIYNQAVSGKKLSTEKTLDIGAANLALANKKHNYEVGRDAVEDAKDSRKEFLPNPIKVEVIDKGYKWQDVPVRAGDKVSNVNQPPKARTTVLGTVLRKTKDGKQELIITASQKPTRSILTKEAIQAQKNDPDYVLTEKDYEMEAEGKTKRYSSIKDPQYVNDIITKSLLDQEGNKYLGIKDYMKRNFGYTESKATQSSPKAKATSKKTKAIQFDKDGNIIM